MLQAMEDDGWVHVRRPAEKDYWNPTSAQVDSNGEPSPSSSQPLKLIFTAPANYWTDSIPIGNGRLGAMIWGGVAKETLQLNEDTLWTGVPGNYTDPNDPAALSQVRKLVDNGQFFEATKEAVRLSDRPSEVYQLLGDMVLEFDTSHLTYDERSYHRELDLDTATATVKYSVGDVGYKREYFASNPNQAIVTKISCSQKGSLSFTLYLDSKMHHHSFVQGKSQIVFQGSCRENPKGIQYAAMLDLQIGEGRGVITVVDDRKLKVQGADRAVILLVASSSFDGPFTKPIDSKKDPTSDCQTALASLRKLSGAQHLNINLQMNYWPALSCNLRECQEPLFDYITSLSVNYEVNGWVAHQVSDIWAKTSPDRGEAVWAFWPMGGAWLCTHLWEHFVYTMDTDFLKNKAYPLLEGCAQFLLGWLIEGPGGFLETNPSTSPEHMFISPDGKQASVSYSSTMDISIIKELFSEFLSAAEILGKTDDELIQKVRDVQPHLPPTKIARDGTVMEWALDFQDPEIHHRHLSHLFGVFPGHTITLQHTPDLCKAAENTLIKRGDVGPGWSTMWKAALWARLHKNEDAYHMVKHLFDLVDPAHEGEYEGGLYSNLFTSHPPFQIDANFGFSAVIAEMLVQSTVKDLYLLPALPRDKWANGCVKGLKARGGVTVNVCWKEGDLHEVGLWLTGGNFVQQCLHYRGRTVNTSLSSGKVYTFNRELMCIRTDSLSLVASC
ncbi:Alpha-L-fucosidase 2 [Linum perenne]